MGNPEAILGEVGMSTASTVHYLSRCSIHTHTHTPRSNSEKPIHPLVRGVEKAENLEETHANMLPDMHLNFVACKTIHALIM